MLVQKRHNTKFCTCCMLELCAAEQRVKCVAKFVEKGAHLACINKQHRAECHTRNVGSHARYSCQCIFSCLTLLLMPTLPVGHARTIAQQCAAAHAPLEVADQGHQRALVVAAGKRFAAAQREVSRCSKLARPAQNAWGRWK